MPLHRPTHLAAVLFLLALAPHAADAQDSAAAAALAPSRARAGVYVGSVPEEYLRALQVAGITPLSQWSLRSFGPQELDRMVVPGPHPWAHRMDFCTGDCVSRSQRARAEFLPVKADAWYNSGFPFGTNDGVVWRGRGATVAAQAGAHARVGPLTLQLAPVVWWAQNQTFPLEPHSRSSTEPFAHPHFPHQIDLPQRFGDATVSEASLGESTIRLDMFGTAMGISTASQWWGPMTVYPYLLGNNAGGFPHVFLGSSRPLDIWIGTVHARLMYADLSQSDLSAIPADSARRFGSGLVATFSPRGLPGLELGAGRFFHSVWGADGVAAADFAKPFEGFIKAGFGRTSAGKLVDDVHNQVASAFARLALPRSGAEIYFEFGREDHSADARDVIGEPDHISMYGLGLRRAWMDGDGRLLALRAEAANFRISHLAEVRAQSPSHLHYTVRQGHTQNGQLLSFGESARSGDALTIDLARYDTRGMSHVRFSRTGEALGITQGAPRLVRYVLGAERTHDLDDFELRGGLAVVQTVGRETRGPRTNVQLTLGSRWRP